MSVNNSLLTAHLLLSVARVVVIQKQDTRKGDIQLTVCGKCRYQTAACAARSLAFAFCEYIMSLQKRLALTDIVILLTI